MYRFPEHELPAGHPDRPRLDALAARLAVSTNRVALVDSLADYIEGGLAQRAELRDLERQAELTERLLAPALSELAALFRELRASLDADLRRAQPSRGGKPYPVGQCLEITRAVLDRLDDVRPDRLSPAAAEGWAALALFRAAGGQVRRAWGDLRGLYFQNALIVGALYVDCANDTVVTTKPPVEILPFADADFRPIADHAHYARIAARYWGHRTLPNHIAPALAPYMPLIQLGPQGAIRLGPLDRYMVALNLAESFSPAERVLVARPMPSAMLAGLKTALGASPVELAASPGEGRTAALAACAERRADGPDRASRAFNQAMTDVRALNRALAGLKLVKTTA